MAAIRQEDGAYRRGVVFGFTVAEIVLLLVFCLLLLFVPLLLDDSLKAPNNLASKAAYVELPSPSADRTQGAAARVIGSPEAAQTARESIAEPDAAKSAAPAMSEPSLADASPAATAAGAPLPEDWIRVAPNAANSKTSRREGGSQSAREGQPAADEPFDALPLASVCKKLGIPAADCTTSVASEKIGLLGRHNWPPIIKLKEADGEFFVVGSAQVSPAFEAKIKKDVVPKILDLVSRFQTDVVEIVGHTDEQPIPPGIPSTLDVVSIDVIAKGESTARLAAADNAGLGFARALAVVQILKKVDQLKDLTILPLSAAQMIDVNGKLSNGNKGGDIKERRRIELRVRQSSGTE